MDTNSIYPSLKDLAVILDHLPDGVTVQDKDGRLIYANDAAAALSGFRSGEEMVGATGPEIVSRFDLADEQGNLLSPADLPGNRARQTGLEQERVIGFSIRNSGKRERWARVKAQPVLTADGEVDIVINIFRDVTDSQMSRAQLRRDVKTWDFIARSGEILASSLDYETILRNVAQVVVPEFADWCTVDMLEDDGMLKRIALAHVDPAKVELAERLAKKYPDQPSEQGGIYNVVKTGQAEMVSEITDEMLKGAARDDEHYAVMQDLGLRSYLCVPLVIRGQPIGAITFVAGETDRRFGPEDLNLAQELARRASLAIDNSRLYHDSQALAEREHEQSVLLNTIISQAPNGFALFDRNHRYVRVNEALAKMNGRDIDGHIGLPIREVVPGLADKMIPLLDRVFSEGTAVTNYEISGETPAQPGMTRYWLVNYYPIQAKTGRILGVGTIVNEITERKEIEQNLRKSEQDLRLLAFHDPLTGLPNRKLLFDRLMQTIKLSSRNEEPLAVLFLDLDRFKNINDTLGHVTGDELLKELAQRLRKCIREVDTAARTGGDEFIVLLNGVRSGQDAIRVARKILKAFSPVFVIEGRKLHISASIGIALYPADGDDALTLVKNADTALYRAKELGGNNYQLYNKTMGIETSEKLRLENELRLAIDNDELTMYYQPIVDVKTGAITEVEALMRWQHPALGLIYPNEFIPMAEETGMIVHMTGAIFRQVTRQLGRWQKMGLGSFRIAVNLSGRQFMQPNMVERIAGYLNESKIDPRNVELEITETLAMKDIGTSIQKLERLKQLGVYITVDDFGTGYSSLNYLKRMPIDAVKIDRSFIQNCITDAQDAAIIQAIISMAQSLNLKVVGEGVESEDQWNLLAKMGCDAIQGYLISRPLPPQEFTKFLRGWNPK